MHCYFSCTLLGSKFLWPSVQFQKQNPYCIAHPWKLCSCLAVILVHPRGSSLGMGRRCPPTPASLLAIGMTPGRLQEWDCWGWLLPRWMKGPGDSNWAGLGIHLGANLFVLCRTRSVGEMGAVFSVPFSLQEMQRCEANQREVKEMWEPYSWGSLTTIRTNIKSQQAFPPSWPWKPSG